MWFLHAFGVQKPRKSSCPAHLHHWKVEKRGLGLWRAFHARHNPKILWRIGTL
jgi:hypothetical protein